METEILQVITDTDRRGAQVFATDLEPELRSRGRTIKTVALAPGHYMEGLAVPVLGPTRLGGVTLRALRQQIRQSRVVVGHGSSTLPACAVAASGLPQPFVYRQISDSLFWAPTRARKMRVRAGMQRAAAIVALWSGSARTLTKHFGVAERKITIIPNGVPAMRFPQATAADRAQARRQLGLPCDAPVALYMGALVPEKGVDTGIRAVSRMAGTYLLVVGDGPERTALERLARDEDGARIRFTGSLDAPWQAYAAADVAVLPSRGGDSMPAVLIEAGLMGLPAVATPVEGIVDIVVQDVTGKLVQPDDAPALAHALRDVLLRKDRYGSAARQHCIERFEITAVAKCWDEVLSRLL